MTSATFDPPYMPRRQRGNRNSSGPPGRISVRSQGFAFGPRGLHEMSNESFQQVVFICTANYYRSRFSEYLFNALAEERGLHLAAATSRGLRAWMAANEGRFPISRRTG